MSKKLTLFVPFLALALLTAGISDVFAAYGDMTARLSARNVTRGQIGEYGSITARANDTITLIVRVRSMDGYPVYNARVTNVLPAGLSYVPNSTTLNGFQTVDGVTSSGLSIGNFLANEEKIVRLAVTVNPAFVPATGSTMIYNIVQIRADNQPLLALQLPVTLSRTAPVVAASNVQTGPADSLLISLATALLATTLYAMYTRTRSFERAIALSELNRISARALNFSR